MTDLAFYTATLYPFQDRVLSCIAGVNTDFYLSGTGVLARIFLNHRCCNDLELTVHDEPRFIPWTNAIIEALDQDMACEMQIFRRESRVTRVKLMQELINMDIYLINDLPCRMGGVRVHPVFGRIDSPENILANKILALITHPNPGDLADIWGLCYQAGLSLDEVIQAEGGKASGVFPLDLARVLCSASRTDWEAVQWVNGPDVEQFVRQCHRLGEKLIFPNGEPLPNK